MKNNGGLHAKRQTAAKWLATTTPSRTRSATGALAREGVRIRALYGARCTSVVIDGCRLVVVVDGEAYRLSPHEARAFGVPKEIQG